MLNEDSNAISADPKADNDKYAKVISSVTDKDIKEFQIQKLALSMIYLNVEPNVGKIIENCNDLVTASRKLRTHFYTDPRC